MRPVAPRLELGHAVEVKEDQIESGEHKTITYARFNLPDSGQRVIVSRWRLNDEERAAIAAGEDLYLYEVGPMREILLTVAPYSPLKDL